MRGLVYFYLFIFGSHVGTRPVYGLAEYRNHGRFCPQAEYWGLSNEAEGCKPCDCDLGGSFDNQCDQLVGLCVCRLNIIGRRCDQPQPGFFTPNLDFYVYEGETADGTGVNG